MIDPYLIDILKKEKERKEKRGERPQVPLHIYPPDFDGYRDEAKDRRQPKKGYIEIDIVGDPEDDPNVIKM